MKIPAVISKPSTKNTFTIKLIVAAALSGHLALVCAEDIPEGYHRMPNGDIMANSPSTAVAPEGYRLTANGILVKQDAGSDSADSAAAPASGMAVAEASTEEAAEEQPIPPGFHRMPDGTLMANSPSNAKVPDGYHMMPDGTLMSNTGGGDHSAHHAHAGGHHHHGAGMWMFDYKYMRMYMEDMLDTTNDVTAEQILAGEYPPYSMAPTDMTMDMHMFMAMYGITDKVMGMVMVHYMSNEMGMLGGTSANPVPSTMESSGFGDTVVSAMVQGPNNLTFNGGISIPTGKIDNSGPMIHDVDARDDDVRYPYGMQLGSGTYDLILGVDYNKTVEKLGMGAEFEYTLRNGTNSEEYTLGDVMLVGGWLKYKVKSGLDTTAKLQFRETGKIDGEDKMIKVAPRSNKDMSPTMDADNYGGRRLDFGLELKYQTPGMLSFGAEYTVPVYQNLFGPQMATKWIAGLSVGVMF